MADTTNIETIQARLHQEALLTMRAAALRRLLVEWDPQSTDAQATYVELLERAHRVLDEARKELPSEQSEEGTKEKSVGSVDEKYEDVQEQ